jgi:hypothetical protein
LGGTITVSSSGIGTGVINTGTINNLGGTIAILIEGSIDNSNAFFNSGTITISNSVGTSFAINTGGTFSNSGTITISNTSGDGIDNTSGTFSNSGTITIQNSGTSTGIYNDSALSNTGTITVSNIGGSSKGIENIIGDGIINNDFGGTITNNGTITNSGTITNNCGATYSGPQPSGILVSDECPSCSPTPDWTINSSCQLSTSASVTGNVTVQSNSVLVIPNGKTLNIDFANNHLLIKSGSKVLIKSGGKIF